MLITLLGIVMLVRVVLLKNAWVPMLVTGKLPIALGIVTAPPLPMYLVIVTAVAVAV